MIKIIIIKFINMNIIAILSMLKIIILPEERTRTPTLAQILAAAAVVTTVKYNMILIFKSTK